MLELMEAPADVDLQWFFCRSTAYVFSDLNRPPYKGGL